jgi:hypothetical protein
MAMNPGMRMMLADRVRQPENYSRSEYGGGNRRMIGYDRDMDGNATTSNYGGTETENRRRRDSRGRYMEGGGEIQNGHYTNYPWSEEMAGGGYETESRRRRDSRGRYMMGRMDDEPEMRGQTWYPPNMHGGSGYSFGDVYADIHAPNAMNRPMHGGMEHEWAKPVDEHTARMWVSEMEGGEKWKPEQIEQLRQTMCPECAKWEFYVAINAMYSDYCETAKKMGVDKPDFYASLARDFLMDEDAKPHKLRRYMETIAK